MTAISDISDELAVIAARTYRRTDQGNAERFVDQYADRLRFVPGIGWHAWDGRLLARDETGEAMRAMKQTVRDLFSELATIDDESERKAAAAHAMKSDSESRLRAALALAQTELPLIATVDTLDGDPFLLACGNGTLDLRTGRLRAPRLDDLLTRGTVVPYDPDATAPRWEQFLTEIFAGDTDLIAFFQRFVGYCLTGDTREHVLAVLHGSGCNGKSVTLAVLKAMLGTLATTAAFDTFARARGDRGPRNDLARLRGARLVAASESGEGRRLDEATVKEITGGDTIAVRFLHQEYFEYVPAFKLWLVTNHRPRVDGDDDAIWRRLRLIPFEQSFEGREDRDLEHKLRAELPGILAWAVRGCRDWQRNGLGAAAAVTRATGEYRAEEDHLGAFLAERCTLDSEAKAPTGDLRAAYDAWCKEMGEHPLAASTLGKRLAKRGIQRGGKGRGLYIGLRLEGGEA